MKEILQEIASGDFTRLEEILQNPKVKRVIESAASRIAKSPEERRELIGTGESIIGELLMRTFKIDPGTLDVEGRFIGYIVKTLPKRLIAYVQKGYVKNAVSLESLMNSDSFADNEFEDMMIERIDLERAIDSLTPKQREVILSIYRDGLNLFEISQRIGNSISSVSQIKKRALRILALKLRDDE